MEYATCTTCNYPYQVPSLGCDNPACPGNPRLTPEHKQALLDAHAKAQAEREERERLAAIRRRKLPI